ncbi:MAG: Malonyl-CoA decarboxylase, partial [Labilithrix sp.]|nr:Malonyl-CoA decarboxylase [Labilithrix sp.]
MLTVPVADALPAFVARLAARFFEAPPPRRRRFLRSADATASRLALALAVRRELLQSASTPAARALEEALRMRLADALGPENQADARDRARMRVTPGLESLARCYLEAMKSDGSPVDPVARFHLGNGALLDDIRVDADPSTRGFK